MNSRPRFLLCNWMWPRSIFRKSSTFSTRIKMVVSRTRSSLRRSGAHFQPKENSLSKKHSNPSKKTTVVKSTFASSSKSIAQKPIPLLSMGGEQSVRPTRSSATLLMTITILMPASLWPSVSSVITIQMCRLSSLVMTSSVIFWMGHGSWNRHQPVISNSRDPFPPITWDLKITGIRGFSRVRSPLTILSAKATDTMSSVKAQSESLSLTHRPGETVMSIGRSRDSHRLHSPCTITINTIRASLRRHCKSRISLNHSFQRANWNNVTSCLRNSAKLWTCEECEAT